MGDQVENTNLTVHVSWLLIPSEIWNVMLGIIKCPSTLEALSTVCKQLRRLCFERMFALAGCVETESLLSQSTELRESLDRIHRFSFRFNVIDPFPAHLNWQEVSVNTLTYKSVTPDSQLENIYLMIATLNESANSPQNSVHTFSTIINNIHLNPLKILILCRAPVTLKIAGYFEVFHLITIHLKWCYFEKRIYEWTNLDSLKELRVDVNMELNFKPPKKLERLFVCCHPSSDLSSPFYGCSIRARDCEMLREV